MKLSSFFLVIFFVLYTFGCVEKTTFSGKIINHNDLSKLNISNKKELYSKFGLPSYIDEIQKTYFYYTEKNKTKNFYNKKTEYSYLFIFKLDENNNVVSSESINLLNDDFAVYNENKTPNNIIERGWIEKIFGGVGPEKLPNSP